MTLPAIAEVAMRTVAPMLGLDLKRGGDLHDKDLERAKHMAAFVSQWPAETSSLAMVRYAARAMGERMPESFPAPMLRIAFDVFRFTAGEMLNEEAAHEMRWQRARDEARQRANVGRLRDDQRAMSHVPEKGAFDLA